MKDHELIDVFLQIQESNYFYYLLVAMGKPFTEVIRFGEMFQSHWFVFLIFLY